MKRGGLGYVDGQRAMSIASGLVWFKSRHGRSEGDECAKSYLPREPRIYMG